MTGPEHYREAERFAQYAGEWYRTSDGSEENVALAQASGSIAQAHATLALVAAVAALDGHEGPGGGSTLARTLRDAAAWEPLIEPAGGAS